MYRQPQLQELVDKKQELEREINEYNNLKDLLAFLLIENPSEYTSLVDIGSKCLMRAVVEQPTTVYVNVGAGVHVDLPLEEAVKVADKRIALIRRYVRRIDAQETTSFVP
jgi:prefoldin alpha subunit